MNIFIARLLTFKLKILNLSESKCPKLEIWFLEMQIAKNSPDEQIYLQFLSYLARHLGCVRGFSRLILFSFVAGVNCVFSLVLSVYNFTRHWIVEPFLKEFLAGFRLRDYIIKI